MAMPFFLWIVGVSMALSFRRTIEQDLIDRVLEAEVERRSSSLLLVAAIKAAVCFSMANIIAAATEAGKS